MESSCFRKSLSLPPHLSFSDAGKVPFLSLRPTSKSKRRLFLINASTSSCRQYKYASIIKTGTETAAQNTQALELPGRKSPLIEKTLATVDKGMKSMVKIVILDKLCALLFEIRASRVVMYCRYPMASAFVNCLQHAQDPSPISIHQFPIVAALPRHLDSGRLHSQLADRVRPCFLPFPG
jgi:hypothetical protein